MDSSTDDYLRGIQTSKDELAQINVRLTAAHLKFLLKRLSAEGTRIAQRMLDHSPRLDLSSLSDFERRAIERCDPKLRHLFFIDSSYLQSNPFVAAHYRCMLGLSKKAAMKSIKLIFRVEESGKCPSTITSAFKAEIDRANRALIDAYSSVDFNAKLADLVVASVVGATLDGIWRNEIGSLAEFEVADAISFFAGESITAVISSKGKWKVTSGSIERVRTLINYLRDEFVKITEIEFRNGSRISFPSNPDMEIFDAHGKKIAVGELKGNTDPANVWERWPLAEKTLGEAKRNEPSILTIFIGEVITENLAFGDFAGARRTRNATGEEATRNGIKQRIVDGTVDYVFKKSTLRQSSKFREMLARTTGITDLSMPEMPKVASFEPVRDKDLDKSN